MRTRITATLITLVGGSAAFLLGPVIFPPAPGLPTPTPVQVPFFLALGIVEALFFGLGLAFIALGYRPVRRAAQVAGMNPWPVYVSIAWMLASWWPHISLHGMVGIDLTGLLFVDYSFHLTLIIAAAIVARFFLATVRHASETADSSRHRPIRVVRAA